MAGGYALVVGGGAYVLSGYSHLLSGDGHVVDGDIYALGTCPVFLMPVLGVIAIILLHIQTPNIMHTRCSGTYHCFALAFSPINFSNECTIMTKDIGTCIILHFCMFTCLQHELLTQEFNHTGFYFTFF